jgi:hypothetical protein
MHIQFKFFDESNKLSFAFWWEGDAAEMEKVKAEVEKTAAENDVTPTVASRGLLRLIGLEGKLRGEHQIYCAVYVVLKSLTSVFASQPNVTAEVRAHRDQLSVELFVREHVLLN